MRDQGVEDVESVLREIQNVVPEQETPVVTSHSGLFGGRAQRVTPDHPEWTPLPATPVPSGLDQFAGRLVRVQRLHVQVPCHVE